MARKATELFPLWAIVCSVWAYRSPSLFSPLKPAILPLLGVVMFGMGTSLTFRNFLSVFERPRVVALGTGMQFLVMPLLAWLISGAFGLPAEYTIGMVIVGSCPGGTASNVISYLAKADVALSVTLTSVSTLLSFLATPFLTWLYLGEAVDVPFVRMLVSIVKIVIAPVVLGTLVNTLWGKTLRKARDLFPAVSVAAIVVIISIIVAIQRDSIAQTGLLVFAAVVLHNLLGLAAGYGAARAFRLGERERRTLSIEVGMQNSGLGVALAIRYFSAAAALPGALFSVWHNLSGSLLAGYWASREIRRKGAALRLSHGAPAEAERAPRGD